MRMKALSTALTCSIGFRRNVILDCGVDDSDGTRLTVLFLHRVVLAFYLATPRLPSLPAIPPGITGDHR